MNTTHAEFDREAYALKCARKYAQCYLARSNETVQGFRDTRQFEAAHMKAILDGLPEDIHQSEFLDFYYNIVDTRWKELLNDAAWAFYKRHHDLFRKDYLDSICGSEIQSNI